LSSQHDTIDSDKNNNEINKINQSIFDCIKKENIQNDLQAVNANVDTIQTLKNIIQNLNDKCIAYDEKLKEILEHNKQLEIKIMELEKHSSQEENNQENGKKEGINKLYLF